MIRLFLIDNPEDSESREFVNQYKERFLKGKKTTKTLTDASGNLHEFTVFDTSDISDIEFEVLDFRDIRDEVPISRTPCILVILENEDDPERFLEKLRSFQNP